MNKKELIEEVISTIETEIEKSSSTRYYCEDGDIIPTDVGYVNDWFDKYKEVLRKRYCE